MACQQEHSVFETCPQCGFDAFVRNHYFTGKMMGAAEFATETLYHSDKMRHHNLRLHGTGTVCGLRVHQHPSPDCRRRYVVVEPGSALDCCGHEILVAQPEIVDVAGNAEVQRLTADALLHALQLCVRFRDCPTEDVPVLYDECGCDDTACAPNRILESFTIELRVDPPLPPLAATDLQAQGALVATELHGVTGFLRADAAGRVALIDPADATRLVIIDTARRSRRSVALTQPARALALAQDGDHVFVATDSSDGTGVIEVRVFVTADASEVDPVVAGALRKLPGTTAASEVRLATSALAARTLIAQVRASGDLLAFADDPTHVIADAPAAAIASAANLAAFTVAADGGEACAIDASGATPLVRLIDFSGAALTTLAGLPAGAQPVALAAFGFQGAPQLAVASSADRRIYLVDRTSNAVTSIDLQHPPEALGATGDPGTASVWLHVLERESNAWYTQAIALAPMAAAPPQPPLTGAARSVGSGARQVVLVGVNEGGAGGAQAVLDFATLAEGDCGDHVWHQLDGCPACDSGDCVVLATIPYYRSNAELLDLPGAADDLAQRRARIDNRLGRRMLASTASLQAWLECLQMQGGTNGTNGTNGTDGVDGVDGLGLNPDLPKILDISWQHRSQVPVSVWLRDVLSVDANGNPIPADQVIERVRNGVRLPLLTIYFNRRMRGIDRQTLRLRADAPAIAVNNGQPSFLGIYSPFGHEVYGNIIEVLGPLTTPHTNEQSPFAVVFVPRPEYVLAGIALLASGLLFAERLGLEFPTFTLTLKGEFVFAPDAAGAYTQDGVLDGDNIGGRVGRNEARPPPIQGGLNPSGNLTQGGRFESWMFLRPTGDVIGDVAVPAGVGATGIPPTVLNPNFASREALLRLEGVDGDLADRILRARDEAADATLGSVRELRERARITDREWRSLRDLLLIL